MLKMNPQYQMLDVEEDNILLCDNSGNIHAMNESAKLIFELCTKGKTTKEISDCIKSNFSAQMNIEEIVDNYINQLVSKNILISEK